MSIEYSAFDQHSQELAAAKAKKIERESMWQLLYDQLRAEVEHYKRLANQGRGMGGILEERDRYRQALEQIASYEEGKEVSGKFDEPWSARVARKALENK